MLADGLRRINELEAKINKAYKKAEKAGSAQIPPSIYADLDELQALKMRALDEPITSTQEAIATLELAVNGHDCPESRAIRRVIAFLSKTTAVSLIGTLGT